MSFYHCLNQGGLYLVTAPQVCASLLFSKTEAALQAGAGLLQYRDKSNDDAKRMREALGLKGLCRRYQVPFLINDDVALAQVVGADGVHLGADDVDLAAARAILGADAIIGVSCYADLHLARAAAAQGADYVAFGRFFPSCSKPEALPAPLSLLSAARADVRCPIVAIGGILPQHVADLRTAGADWWAVIAGVFAADDVAAATRRYLG